MYVATALEKPPEIFHEKDSNCTPNLCTASTSSSYLAIIFASISKEKWKYIYPIIISILFIPSVFIYYNSSALIHAVWYLVDSGIGFLIGLIIYKITNKK